VNDQPIRLMRFSDLKAAQVVTSWPQLRRMVDGAGFPRGYLLSPGRRVWDAPDVEAWVRSRREAAGNSQAEEA
jgi:predicted DNA-binding transcriptional regulator AlpA